MSSYKLREQLYIGAGRAAQEEATMMLLRKLKVFEGFPGSSDGKESACNSGDPGSIPGSGKSPGGGNGNSLQYSCLENPIDRRAWWAAVHGVAKSQTRLND